MKDPNGTKSWRERRAESDDPELSLDEVAEVSAQSADEFLRTMRERRRRTSDQVVRLSEVAALLAEHNAKSKIAR